MTNTHSILINGAKYLSAADSPSLSVTGTLTLELWYRPVNAPGNNDRDILISKFAETDNQRSYLFFYTNDNGTYKLQFNFSSAGATTSGASVATTLTPGSWHHLAVAYDTVGSLKFYVNGQQVGSTATGLANSIFNSTAPFQVGYNGSDPSGFQNADGYIDDVRVWSVTRSQTEIANNKDVELVGNETNLNAYWKLNNALTDATANGNTLTNNGSATFETVVPGASAFTPKVIIF